MCFNCVLFYLFAVSLFCGFCVIFSVFSVVCFKFYKNVVEKAQFK